MAKSTYKDNGPKIRRAMLRGAKKGLEDLADDIVYQARQRAPVKRGTLARGIKRDPVEEREDGLSTAVRATAPHSAAQEYGSGERGERPGKKYPIRPKKRKFLRWEGSDGKERFATIVWHPGVYPQSYFRPAIDAVEPDAERRIAKKINDEVRKVVT